VALGAAFLTTKGFAASEVERSYERARELCRFPAILYGLAMYHLHRSGTSATDDVNQELLRVAEQRRDTAACAIAHSRLGVSALHSGNQWLAIAHFEQAIAFYYI
jgi:hypothetical protein